MNKKKQLKKQNKHGFEILTDRDNLEEIWDLDNSRKDKGDNFAAMFERSLADAAQQNLLKEKIKAETAVQPISKKELLKKYPPVQKIIDLHGHTGAEAFAVTDHFIKLSKEQGLQTLQIIVGKGHHSEGDPVIPGIVEQKLLELRKQGIVLEYEWEKKDRRKSGSLKVFLS